MAMLRLSSSKLVRLYGNFSHTSAMAIKAIRRENSVSFSTDSSSDSKKKIDLKVAGILKSVIAKKSETDAWMDDHISDISDLTARNILAYLNQIPKVSRKYPFKVRNVTMSSDFDGERIDVVVSSMDHYRKQSDSDGDGGGSDDSYYDFRRRGSCYLLEMEMSVTKENGKVLKIGMTAFNGEIKIKTVSFQVPSQGLGDDPFFTFGPYNVDRYEEMQEGMKEYVAARGIKDFNFLYGFNIHESSFLNDLVYEEANKLPMEALEKLRDFIQY